MGRGPRLRARRRFRPPRVPDRYPLCPLQTTGRGTVQENFRHPADELRVKPDVARLGPRQVGMVSPTDRADGPEGLPRCPLHFQLGEGPLYLLRVINTLTREKP